MVPGNPFGVFFTYQQNSVELGRNHFHLGQQKVSRRRLKEGWPMQPQQRSQWECCKPAQPFTHASSSVQPNGGGDGNDESQSIPGWQRAYRRALQSTDPTGKANSPVRYLAAFWHGHKQPLAKPTSITLYTISNAYSHEISDVN